MSFAVALSRKEDAREHPLRGILTEPKTHTLDVPGAVLHYDSPGGSEPITRLPMGWTTPSAIATTVLLKQAALAGGLVGVGVTRHRVVLAARPQLSASLCSAGDEFRTSQRSKRQWAIPK